MDSKSSEIKNLYPEKAISVVITGRASYFSHVREYEKDILSTFEAYKNALEKAMNWVSELKCEIKDSVKVFSTEYQKPAKATHIPLKAGINEFVFNQKIRVFVKEINEIRECSPECYIEWKNKDISSILNGMQTSSGSLMSVPGTIYKIVMGDGEDLKNTFKNLVSQLRELKKTCSMYDPILKKEISLLNSCDEIVLLRGNANHIEAGVSMTIPYVYEFEKPHLVEVYEVADINCY